MNWGHNLLSWAESTTGISLADPMSRVTARVLSDLGIETEAGQLILNEEDGPSAPST